MIDPDIFASHKAARAYDIVVIAASRGGIQALKTILSTLPSHFPVPIAIVLHRGTAIPNRQAVVLGRSTMLPVKIAAQHEPLLPGTVYLADPHFHLTVGPDRRLELRDGVKIRHLRSAADPLFYSAAHVFASGVLAIVLTGGDGDASNGVREVKAFGGTIIAQDETSSEDYSMPRSAIATGCVDYVLAIENIGPAIMQLVRNRSPVAA